MLEQRGSDDLEQAGNICDGAAATTVRYEYRYDGLNRLTGATGYYEKEPQVGETVMRQFRRGYAYSQNGNLTGKTIYDPVTGTVDDQWTYAYQNHAATSIYTAADGYRFEMGYDANGNMTYQRDNKDSMAKTMAYDSRNRIREVTDPETGNMMGQYWYDDQGFRVRKKSVRTVDGFERVIDIQNPSMYFGREMQRELDGTLIPGTEETVNNLYLQGVRIAAVTRDCGAVYYLTDQVDSVKVVVDQDGQAVTMTEYLPYGETWFQEGDTDHAPKYNSQELDQETGYYFYNARHYDGEIARFVTPDTVIDGEGSTHGWNRYMYVHGNPIKYRDPTGHELMNPNSDDSPLSYSPKWNVEKGDSLSKIVNKLNKDLSLDIKVDDIIKANPKLKKNPNLIHEGDKISLSFLNMSKTYDVTGWEKNLKGAFGRGGAAGVGEGTVIIRENITVKNLNSEREVSITNKKAFRYANITKNLKGLNVEGPQIFAGRGDFYSMDDAVEAFFGDSKSYSTSLVGVTISNELTKERGYKQSDMGRWLIFSGAASAGVFEKSENRTIPLRMKSKSEDIQELAKPEPHKILNPGNR